MDCGEGCQRSFLELSQKLSTVNRICLTHLAHDSIGGLPGMILTSSDITAAAMESAKAALGNSSSPGPSNGLKGSDESKPGLDLIGPTGSNKFCLSLRHFMRREKFEIRIKEGNYSEQEEKKLKQKKMKQKGNQRGGESFRVSSIAFQRNNSNRCVGQKRPRCDLASEEVLSFVFTSPPILGKFLAEKAKALGIPPGPLYGQLKSGQAATFQDQDGKQRRVESHEVVEPGSPGIRVAIFYYPSYDVFHQIMSCKAINELRGVEDETQPKLELVVHMAPRDIFNSTVCIDWMEGFGSNVEHIYLETSISLEQYEKGYNDCGTPFRSAALGAQSRSLLSSDIYRALKITKPTVHTQEHTTTGNVSITNARPLLEYVLIPRSKKGYQNYEPVPVTWDELNREAKSSVESTGSSALARELISDMPPHEEGKNAEIIFTGTGSAIPCKHRNVSGIYVRMDNRNAMLLDAGEGTTGQLLRVVQDANYIELLKGIKAVWISHPHADHHLGILRLLTERQRICSAEDNPVTLIAPPNLNYFLQEYAVVDPTITGSYEFLDCYNLMFNKKRESWSEENLRHHDELMKRLESDLGVTSIQAIPVSHCKHAFAVILRGTSFGSLAYSGDCRPSIPFARAGLNVDLLIHEATFSDGMEMEASVKKHCTVGEALEVACNMQAKAVVLTHFSQRYPKIPPLPIKTTGSPDIPIIFAFDFAALTPRTLVAASKATPALRLLYPDEPNCDDEAKATELSTAKAALEIPGFFAQEAVL